MRVAVPTIRAALKRGPLVLCYHSIADVDHDDDPAYLCVPPDRFRFQLELLTEAGATFVTFAALAARIRAGEPTAKVVAVSFDDGYHDNLAAALPIMQELKVPSTVFVATGLLGGPSPWVSERSGVRMMDATEVRELGDAGVELGGHTITHPDLTLLDREACRHEVVDGKTQLEELAGRPVTSFSFPFFRFDDAARAVVEAAGFDAAGAGLGQGSLNDPMLLRRTLIGRKDRTGGFVARVSGLHDVMYGSVSGQKLRAATRPARGAARKVLERRR